jgi:gamma-glutamyltranspeptidase / glutathione hydrolase
LHINYRGYDVYSNPSSSRGGFELEMALNLVEPYDLAKMGNESPEALNLEMEAIKVSKADIYHYVADTRDKQVPTTELLSKQFANSRGKLIQLDTAMPYPGWGEVSSPNSTTALLERPQRPIFPEHYDVEHDTTSFSIIDPEGNAVACTPTIGGGFGNGVVVGDTGLLLNNGMRLGATSPYPDSVNYVKPGQRPLLNNSPVIVMKDGKVVIVYGTPGGETIGQTEFQMLVNLIDFKLPVQQAVENPRFEIDANPSFYKPGAQILVTIENRVPPATLDALRKMGYDLKLGGDFTALVGGMQAVVVDEKTGTMTAGADPRRTGYAVGW